MNKKSRKRKASSLAGLKKATENEHRDMIRHLLDRPMNDAPTSFASATQRRLASLDARPRYLPNGFRSNSRSTR